MKSKANASPVKSSLAMSPKPLRRRATTALFAAVIALLLAIPSVASADPLGSSTFYSGLRSTAFALTATPGPDGNVWFVDLGLSSVSAIGRITPKGEVKEYDLNAASVPVAIVAGPKSEKYLWFTDKGTTPAIGYIDSASPEIAVEPPAISASLKPGSKPQGIAVGPDGNVWFTDAGTTPAIGVVNPSTKELVKEECSSGLAEGSLPRGIVAGPDGNLWFIDSGTTRAIGRINPSNCEIKEFPTGENSEPGGTNSEFGPWGIVAGSDGNVWFTENGSNETNGKAVCKITPSGTITCFKAGLIASSQPAALTAAGGKLWFTDQSGVNEEQEFEISATENLGGIYKLGYKGQETGGTGSGNLLSGAKGKGDVKRFTTSCKRTAGSKVLKSCTTIVGAEVGMRITGTGIPATEPFAVIEKIESPNIIISRAASSGAETATTVTAGRIINVETTSGKLELGQTIEGTGIAASAIVALGEEGGKGTIIPQTPPTAAGTGIALTGKTTTVVTGVTTSTGVFAIGETISGKGVPAGCTITAINTNLKTLTLSCTPTEAGTGVSLSADLGYNATSTAVREALQGLSTIQAGNVLSGGTGGESPVKRTVKFEGDLQKIDVDLLSCNGAGLTPVGAICNVTTIQPGIPNAIACMTTSGGACGRYPLNELKRGTFELTYGPDGNLWVSTGVTTNAKFGKFGITPPTKKLTVTKTGAGSGTVKVSPEGTSCGVGCYEEEEGAEVTLEAEAEAGSEFREWSGACSGKGSCEVTMSEAKSVNAFFAHAKQTLTVKQEGTGAGTTSSKPKGIKCAGTCTSAIAELPEGTTVLLSAKALTGSNLTGFSGCESTTKPTEFEGTCTVKMSAAKEVKVTYGLTAKAILNPVVLTLSKAGTGHGTVKATGLTCEADCTSTEVKYTSGDGGKKLPAKVILKATSQAGSDPVSWTGCESNPTPSECLVTTTAAKAVTARFEE